MATPYAHSLPGEPISAWEPLAAHAEAVGSAASNFAARIGWSDAGKAVGLLHDAGKCSTEFQAYLRATDTGRTRRVDHSTKGARIAAERYGVLGRLIAACIAGHHAGLPDPTELDRRLDTAHPIPDASNWATSIPMPPAEVQPQRKMVAHTPEERAFSAAFLARMLFSCLVDADFLETERFLSRGTIRRRISAPLNELRQHLADHMARLAEREGECGELNKLRIAIRAHALGKAEQAPGLFTLTVPTGGGKTLTSLNFALDHALRHGRRRIIYVIPFTSIIEQTAAVFREALGHPRAILEHHASFDWERVARDLGDSGDERDGQGALRRAAENWDAPIIVTTAVQFFESLFAARTSACRKLHNIVDSVVILDEAQTLPIRLLLPCIAALRELTRNYGVSAVLCTATQPALRVQDQALVDTAGNSLGLDIPDSRELAPDPPDLYTRLKRVRIEVRAGETEDEVIAAQFTASPRMLCIVNTRTHARELFDRIVHLEGAVHLSTLMCPAHRSMVLIDLRDRLGRRY
jgi:CRISPR-associated endonuclease/helicase Cas3